MPRLRQPMTAKKEEPFDSTKVEKPIEEEVVKEPQLEAVADDEPEVIVEEPKEEPKVEAKAEPKQDEAAVALRRQVEALRQSEELLRREQEASKIQNQRDVLSAQEDTLKGAIQQADSDAQKVLLEIERAIDAGDVKAQVEAQRRLARAESRMLFFEEKVELIKEQRRELKKERQRLQEQKDTKPQQPGDLPHIAAWRQAHPDYFTDPVKANDLSAAFYTALKDGMEAYSPAHVARINELLGFSEPRQEVQPEKKAPSIVSAPVSREVPSGGSGQRQTSRITLTRDQLEAAKVAGVSPAEYARQLIKLNEMKANGEYGERR